MGVAPSTFQVVYIRLMYFLKLIHGVYGIYIHIVKMDIISMCTFIPEIL